MTVIEKAKGRSPYATKQKSPFQYSPEYDRWAKAIATNDTEETYAADCAFRRRFDVPLSACAA